MKLATWNDGSRDGKLMLVSRDLKVAKRVGVIANTLQSALDNWERVSPLLEVMYKELNLGLSRGTVEFDPKQCLSPLPRAYHWADASAYVNHVELVRKARGAEIPDSFWHDPLMYQGGSDSFLSPHQDIKMGSTQWGIDFEAELAVITKDVPMGLPASNTRERICLMMLVNDVSLRNLIPAELAKGFGFYQSKPSSAFSPVAVTLDELGESWDGEKCHLELHSYLNGQLFGKPNAGVDMTFSFPQLIAHAAKTRPLCAGTIVGSGTVSNKDESVGSSCIAEKRMLEILATGHAATPFMAFGDQVKIEMLGSDGLTIFGDINQTLQAFHGHDF